MENTKSHFIEIESHEGKDLIIRSTASREETAGILAAAGLIRLGFEDRITSAISVDDSLLLLGRLDGRLHGSTCADIFLARSRLEGAAALAGVNGQRTLHPTPHANSPDRQNSLHRRYFLTPFNIRAAALDDGASLRP